MRKKVSQFVVIVLMILLLFDFLLEKEIVFDTVSYSLMIWVQNLLPSMFPFFVVSSILIRYHITNYIPQVIKNSFCYLFGVSENVITIFFLSCLSGFPANARITRMLYDNNEISASEASHTLLFTHFSNPIFILSTVSVLFLHHEEYGLLILFSHYIGNVILGILSRKNINHIDYTKKEVKSQKFSRVFIVAIKSSIDTSLLILGTLACFLVFSSLLIHHLNLSIYPSIILKGILEITMGLKNLSVMMIPDIYKVVISCMFLSFGGFSVHLQVLSQIADTDISYHPFFVARVFHMIISGVISFLLYHIFFI